MRVVVVVGVVGRGKGRGRGKWSGRRWLLLLVAAAGLV